MKISIAKDNNFETIGILVTSNDARLFYWGVEPNSAFNFAKDVQTSQWTTEIFELVRLSTVIRERSHFVQDWFEVATKAKTVTIEEGKGVDFAMYRDETNELTAKMEKIIKNII